ncbi:MAG: myxosortase MrtP, partial [Bradymonadaceae bacterium]
GWPRGAIWGLGATLLTLPFFFAGFYLWETQTSDRDFDFDLDHYRQWPAELEGKPASWGTEQGVWVWTSNGDLRIGMPGKATPFQDVEVTADSPFYWHAIGSARALPSSTSEGIQLGESSVRTRHGLAQTWHVGPGPMGTRAELVLSPRTFKDSPETLPDSLRIRSYSTREGGEGAPIFTGPTASPVDGDLEIDRTRMWLLLWALTHLFFVALPEEYFYRGYLQTRIGQALKARRMARGKSDEPRRRLGISWSNLITSSLFALGHVLIPVGGALLISRAAVFFPSLLFGWLRERTDSIVAPVIYHGACNMMVIIAAVHFV